MVTIKEASEQYGLTQDTLRYYERVQLELARRKRSPRRTITNSPFPGKIICGDCGEVFVSKVWHSNSKYCRIIWRSNAKYKNGMI